MPLSDSLVGLLRPFLAELERGQRLFNMWNSPRLSELIEADLEAARGVWLEEAGDDESERQRRAEMDFLVYQDSAGRFADFHSARHGFITHLAAAGVHPKVAQSLARHSDINLTLSRYSHVLSGQEADAVNLLPDFGKKRADADAPKAVAEGAGR